MSLKTTSCLGKHRKKNPIKKAKNIKSIALYIMGKCSGRSTKKDA